MSSTALPAEHQSAILGRCSCSSTDSIRSARTWTGYLATVNTQHDSDRHVGQAVPLQNTTSCMLGDSCSSADSTNSHYHADKGSAQLTPEDAQRQHDRHVGQGPHHAQEHHEARLPGGFCRREGGCGVVGQLQLLLPRAVVPASQGRGSKAG